MKLIFVIALILFSLPAYGAGQRTSGSSRTDGFATSVRGSAWYYTPTASTNLVLWLDFPPTDTTSSYRDRSGGTGTFTATGGPQLVVVDGNSCAWFDGTQSIKSPATNNFDGLSAYTMSVWVKQTNFVLYAGIFFSRGGYVNGLDTYSASSLGLFSGTKSFAASSIAVTNWTHVAFTVASGATLVYTNGVYRTSGTLEALKVDDYWYVGWDDNNAGWKFKGYIDELRLYNRALSSNEISRIYSEGRVAP